MTIETVEQIVALLNDYSVSEITLEQEGQRLCVRKPLPPVNAFPPVLSEEEMETPDLSEEAGPVTEASEPAGPAILTATMVGLFRHATPTVGYGALVTPGQVVGNIESMKVLNDVHAAEGGRVADVFVEEGAPVEYGQPLFRLVPE